MSNTISMSIGGDGIAELKIDVPGVSMNVLTPELVAELGQAVVRIAGDPAIKGAIITSGKAAFLAGADLKEFGRRFRKGLTLEQALETTRDVSAVFRRLETCGKPVVAAINGTALGGGFELALACHHRVLVDDPAVVVGLPEVTVGLLPGAGGTQRVPRLIGIVASLPLIAEGKKLRPAEALKLGLVHALVPASELAGRRARLAALAAFGRAAVGPEGLPRSGRHRRRAPRRSRSTSWRRRRLRRK